MIDVADMRILFFGAGVLGSVYAARLVEAGYDVTVLARGQRLADIREHGIVLETFGSGERTSTPVKVVDRMPRDEHFDVCVVPIQATQVEAALPALAENPHIPSFVFMHNTVTGFEPLIDALGRERVLIGHANIGGERDGHVVHYMASQNMTFGELDGSESERLKRIADAFRAAGFGVEFNADMDAWKRYHMAFGTPMVNAMYMAGSCNYRLARDREALRMFIRGMREAFAVLQAKEFPIEPKSMRILAALPDFLLMLLFRIVMRMRIMDIGGARHARNAREEMATLSRQLLSLAKETDVPTPTLRELHRHALEPTAT
ncbi:MAG: ketopantoate reductase family protein [Trueperaceae bacterium]|nr:MAG: ketopantoate reductase family protein [Trueperaceae bacterium]